MADVCDQAQALAERERTALLDAARGRAVATGGDGYCRDCGDAIAPARLAALPGACRCSFCQGERERQAKGGR